MDPLQQKITSWQRHYVISSDPGSNKMRIATHHSWPPSVTPQWHIDGEHLACSTFLSLCSLCPPCPTPQFQTPGSVFAPEHAGLATIPHFVLSFQRSLRTFGTLKVIGSYRKLSRPTEYQLQTGAMGKETKGLGLFFLKHWQILELALANKRRCFPNM